MHESRAGSSAGFAGLVAAEAGSREEQPAANDNNIPTIIHAKKLALAFMVSPIFKTR
jgi:hypothetical protein